MTAQLVYQPIVQHYERRLAKHKNGHLAVDWPNAIDLTKRFHVMTALCKEDVGSLLDFGCGVGLYHDYLLNFHPDLVPHYCGLDISPEFTRVFAQNHPSVRVICRDVLLSPLAERFDYCVMNGVLTVKNALSWKSMWEYAQKLLLTVFARVDVGLAFNVMADWVQWSRVDLFHLPVEILIPWLRENLSHHFHIRVDYGLYEYTVYVYRESQL